VKDALPVSYSKISPLLLSS